MAKPVTHFSALLLLALPPMVNAAGDPTRPPAAYLAPAPSAARPSTPLNLVLQSVRLSGSARIAVINGQSLRTGESIGDSRLVLIEESRVTLQGPQGRWILELTPGVRKQPAKPIHSGDKAQ